jgi:DNA-directed RNA polymerase subunit M/transcription elongation factor TFIIS
MSKTVYSDEEIDDLDDIEEEEDNIEEEDDIEEKDEDLEEKDEDIEEKDEDIEEKDEDIEEDELDVKDDEGGDFLGGENDIIEFDNGGDDTFTFEDNKRKKATRRKVTKKKLFPFIQKKKRITGTEERQEDNYLSIDIRKTTLQFLTDYVNSHGKSLNEREPAIFEKAIYEASLISGCMDCQKYLDTVKYFVGAFESLKKKDIIAEIRRASGGWSSVLFKNASDAEKHEIDKLLNPLEASDNPDYPCPRCRSTKSYRSIKNLRSGDEGASALFLCGNRSCGFRWRING